MNFFSNRSFFKRNPKLYILPFITLVFLAPFFSCKKEKGINQLEWQNESLRLTADLCKKFRECADKEWSSIPENLKKFTEARLDEANCQKRFRESNAYKLIGGEAFQIQSAYRECHTKVLAFTCEEFKSGKINLIPACVSFQKIQN